ncbi:diguanylate cyclase [Pseudomonas benzenivorans]|uniref:Diguanylate cyclase n=1 Tax=Pseudomonas benzenivorans TaxID=556533 RepID=A0ABZ0PSW6_9PSED|nr:diguanylate cyclase [Pseudomonas benzenivorans]WPC04009.1 diguanylate cyclase [Pseudomonas benzenivorans]
MKKPPYLPSSNVIDLLLDAICVVDREGHFVFVSAACERIFGYAPEELLGRAMIDLVFPEDRAMTLQAAREIMAGHSKPHFENRYVRKDGQIAHIMWSARWSEEEQVRIAVARDITERKRGESMLAATYAISEAAHSAEDLLGLFQRVQRIIGELLPASNFTVVLRDEQDERLSVAYQAGECPRTSASPQPDPLSLSAPIICNGQTLRHSPTPENAGDAGHWLGVPLNARKGIIGALIVQSRDPGMRYGERDQELLQYVSTQVAAAIEHQKMLGRLQFMAQYDPLTRLPNRPLLYDRVHLALARARRDQAQVALLFLDLDRFKQVNDNHGHAVGDRLLQQVALRLQSCIRQTDTAARLGGDEFVVLLEEIHSPEQVMAVAEKIRLALTPPFELDEHSLYVPPSIGVALYPHHAGDTQQLLQYADNAMYQAKKRGGNAVQIAPEAATALSGS